jgi:hypothetical protein
MSTRSIMALCFVLAALGWFALGSFTRDNAPTEWNRWIALAMLWPTLLTTFTPLLYGVHLLLGRSKGILPRVLRQSVLAALFLTLAAWLQMMRALNWANAILMLALFVMTDILLAARESA